MASDGSSVTKMMEQAPLPQMVLNLTRALGDAQNDLTRNAVDTLLRMADPENGVQLPGDQSKRSLLELGLEPSFFHISEATICARVAFSCSETTEYGAGLSVGGGIIGVFSASVNANYSNKYSFDASSSSEITTRIISVPAPSELTERLRLAREHKAP